MLECALLRHLKHKQICETSEQHSKSDLAQTWSLQGSYGFDSFGALLPWHAFFPSACDSPLWQASAARTRLFTFVASAHCTLSDRIKNNYLQYGCYPMCTKRTLTPIWNLHPDYFGTVNKTRSLDCPRLQHITVCKNLCHTQFICPVQISSLISK